MELTLEGLGLTTEQLRDLVVERLAETLLGTDDTEGELAIEIESAYKKQVAERVKAIAETAVLPRVQELLDKTTFQETNRWGEQQKPPVSLKEFLISRAEAWMTEQVNYQGKSRTEDSYNWTASQTRVGHMIHQHLQYEIERSVKAALADINTKLALGISETVKMKLAETLKTLTVSANVR